MLGRVWRGVGARDKYVSECINENSCVQDKQMFSCINCSMMGVYSNVFVNVCIRECVRK